MNFLTQRRLQQNGVVLITILLIFAATTVLVTSIQFRFQHSARLQGLVMVDAQARAYKDGAELLAGLQLQADGIEDKQNAILADHAGESWAQPQTYPIDGGEIRTQLVDLQGRLNLANLGSDEKIQAVLLNLLRELGIPSDGQVSAEDLITIMRDWMDADQVQQGFIPSEDTYYLNLSEEQSDNTGYLTADAPLSHLSELLLLRGISKQDYARLAEFVTILPSSAKININSIALPLAKALNPAGGEDLVITRPEEGFKQADLGSLAAAQRPSLNFGVDSHFFELRTEVAFGDVISQHVSLLYMPEVVEPNDPPKPLILSRDLSWPFYYAL